MSLKPTTVSYFFQRKKRYTYACSWLGDRSKENLCKAAERKIVEVNLYYLGLIQRCII